MLHMMDSAAKSIPCFGFIPLDIAILLFQRDICQNENLCKAGFFVGITAGQGNGVAVQVYKHILNGQTAAELLKNQYVLSFVTVKGVCIVCDAVDIGIAVLLHNAARLADACFTVNIGGV